MMNFEVVVLLEGQIGVYRVGAVIKPFNRFYSRLTECDEEIFPTWINRITVQLLRHHYLESRRRIDMIYQGYNGLIKIAIVAAFDDRYLLERSHTGKGSQ